MERDPLSTKTKSGLKRHKIVEYTQCNPLLLFQGKIFTFRLGCSNHLFFNFFGNAITRSHQPSLKCLWATCNLFFSPINSSVEMGREDLMRYSRQVGSCQIGSWHVRVGNNQLWRSKKENIFFFFMEALWDGCFK